ncbi:hypothetical protein INR49_008925 [Caranx melampygus]|nr:hypothetical protein INR49_008925 [Caranx melampygus]
MADTLRRLTNTCSFSVLQDKLESWHKDYHVISCDQNLNRCCELIELTAKIQGQLFSILNLTAAEGGHYAGVDTLKTRLLPWLGTCFSMAKPSLTDDTRLSGKGQEDQGLSASHEDDMQKMETQLCSTRLHLDSVRAELADAQKELDDTKSKSATTLLATEDEILQLKEEWRYKRKLDALDDYERQIRMLRDEAGKKSFSKPNVQTQPLPSPMRSDSPTRAQLTNSSRHARWCLASVTCMLWSESFKTAKLAYRHFKLRVKKTLSPSHYGPESLDDAAVDYIVRNLDLYDVQDSVNSVINAMNVNPRISFHQKWTLPHQHLD